MGIGKNYALLQLKTNRLALLFFIMKTLYTKVFFTLCILQPKYYFISTGVLPFALFGIRCIAVKKQSLTLLLQLLNGLDHRCITLCLAFLLTCILKGYLYFH